MTFEFEDFADEAPQVETVKVKVTLAIDRDRRNIGVLVGEESEWDPDVVSDIIAECPSKYTKAEVEIIKNEDDKPRSYRLDSEQFPIYYASTEDLINHNLDAQDYGQPFIVVRGCIQFIDPNNTGW